MAIMRKAYMSWREIIEFGRIGCPACCSALLLSLRVSGSQARKWRRLRQRRHLRACEPETRKDKSKAEQQAGHPILPNSMISRHDIYALRIIAIQLAITRPSRLCEPQIALPDARALLYACT